MMMWKYLQGYHHVGEMMGENAWERNFSLNEGHLEVLHLERNSSLNYLRPRKQEKVTGMAGWFW